MSNLLVISAFIFAVCAELLAVQMVLFSGP
jgi:hypothetical protein